MQTVRASSLPRLMTCVPSVLNPDGLVPVELENPAAAAGTLVHRMVERIIQDGNASTDEFRGRLGGGDFDRAELLVRNFLTVWQQAHRVMPDPQTEVAVEYTLGDAVRITGHIDVLHLDPLRAFVLDWKTGRQHEDHYHQVAAYAYGAWVKANRPTPYTIYASVVYLEDKTVLPYEFTVDALMEWEREVLEKIGDTRYVVGRKCAVCTLQDSCPAYRAFAGNALSLLMKAEKSGKQIRLRDLTPEESGGILDSLYALGKAKDRVQLAVRNHVQRFGPLDLGSGKEYVLVPETKKELDTKAARKILAKRIGTEAVEAISTVPLKDALKEYSKLASRGMKGTAKAELLQELEDAGAIKTTVTERLWRRPKGEATLEEV